MTAALTCATRQTRPRPASSSIWAVILCTLVLVACGPADPPSPGPATSTPAEDAPTAVLPAATFTGQPRTVLLWGTQLSGAHIDLEAVTETLTELAHQSGWVVQQGPGASQVDPASVGMVVYLQDKFPEDLFDELAANTPFVWIGDSGASEASNSLQLVFPTRASDRQGLLAGYIAALMTHDWRVAAITGSNETGIRQNILDGARYMCGLCRPTLPPYANFPLSYQIENLSDPGSVDQLLAELNLLDVRTVVLSPLAGEPRLISSLTQAGIRMIGMKPPGDARTNAWAATVRYGPELVLPHAWQAALAGGDPGSMTIPLTIADRNPELLSDARLRLARETMEDINRGLLSPAPDV